MASTDARPIPIKNTALRITFPIWDADGDLVTGAAGLDSEVSKDGGTFTDCTNEATEIATSSGMYYLDITSTEMNADTVAIIVKTSTTGAKTTVVVLYPQESGDVKVDVETVKTQTVTCAAGVTVGAYVGNATAAISVDASGRLDISKMGGTSLTARDIGASVLLSSGTGTGQISLASGAVTVGTNNDKTGYSLTQAFPTNFSSLAITVGGAVTAGTVSDKTGYSLTQSFPTNFSSLAITAGGAVTAGTVSDKTGYSLASGGLAAITSWTVNVTGSLSGSVGSVTGNVGGNVVGSVGSISGVSFPTNFALMSINGSGYVTYANSAPPSAASIASLVWDEDVVSSHTTANSAGWSLNNAHAGADMAYSTAVAIKAKTDNLPASPAATGDIPSAATVASQVRTELTTELGRIDVATSTRLAAASYSAPPSAATISSTVWAETSRTLTAFGFTVTTSDSSNISSILADTNELQTDWANGGRLDLILDARSSQTSVDDLPTNAELATALAGADDAVLAAIAALSVPTATQVADAVLSRNVSNVEGSAPEHSLCTIVLASLESSVSGSTWTIKRTNGTTTHATKTVTSDAAASPITGVS